MASWVIHLRVAEQLWNRIQLEDRTAFVMGNIAPDSGIPNSDVSGFIPSSEISHFRTTDKNGFKDVHEEQFIEKFFTEEQRRSYTKRQYTFYFGYLTHLLTDKLWIDKIVYPAKEQFLELYYTNRKDFFSFLKKDWYELDFLFLKKNPDFSAFQIYKNIEEFKNIYLDFFKEDAFEERKNYIVEFYRRGVENVKERERYLTMEELDCFVDLTVQAIMVLCKSYIKEFLNI